MSRLNKFFRKLEDMGMKKAKYGWIWIILSIVTSLGMIIFVQKMCDKKDEV